MFRFHVGGDIIDNMYFDYMVAIARDFPATKFLAFTKKYEIVNDYISNGDTIPDNMSIVFSSWIGLEMINPHSFPVAWYQDGTETRIPESAIECFGTCDSCGICWNLKYLGVDVLFYDHN